jgi:hypothetical protein
MDIIESIKHFADLDFYLKVAIPIGYLSYIVSRLGLNYKDSNVDKIFGTFVFAGISSIPFILLPCSSWVWFWFNLALMFIVPLLLAVSWKKWLHKFFFIATHFLKIANSTEFPNTWNELTQNTSLSPTSITVYLKSGEAYLCDYTDTFKDSPIQKFRTDQECNIALYITHERKSRDSLFEAVKDKPIISHKNNIKSYRLRYIPASEIESIEFVV